MKTCNSSEMDKDERFKHITTDPKFKHIPKRERKVKIDKRFQSMFKDKKFKSKYTVDKRGRPVNYTSTEVLKRYYALDTDDSDNSDSANESDEEQTGGKYELPPQPRSNIESEDENRCESWNNVDVPRKDISVKEKVKERLKDMNVDYARGQGILLSDSSSDDESESDESVSEVDHGWGELDKDAEKTDEVTNRLAVCNMDWDRIRAVDLMVLFNSFLPPGGFIKSITIYPSDFGLQRIKEEEKKGPIELVERKTSNDSDEEETEEGSKYHMEKLRQYQLNRLKYYYGVMVCDSPETANKIYTECDGVEYESSATKIDLRFIPDDMEFENKPKEVCDRIPDKYEPRFFTTTALQQAKVQLTWDETNPDRIEITKKLSEGKIDDISEADLHAYLASSSEGETETDENSESSAEENVKDDVNRIDKYRALLQDIENAEKKKKDKDIGMEITWNLDLKEKSEKLVKKKLAEADDKTPFQQYLDKRKEKRNAKREERKKQLDENKTESEDNDIPSDIDMNDPYFAEEFNNSEFKKSKKKVKKTSESNKDAEERDAELELLLLNENEDNKKHFSLKKIQESEKSKKKRKTKKNSKEEELNEDEFKVNVKDERFSALFSSHHFNIDPTDPHFQKTKAMDAIIEEKLKRRIKDDLNVDNKKLKMEKKKDAELNVLVKSVKRKTKALIIKK